jgi:translocation and assembly module TamB
MADLPDLDETDRPGTGRGPIAAVRPHRSWWRRAARALATAVLLALLLVLGAIWAIDTDPGHRFLADRLAAARPQSGLRIHVGRIDGSIWGRMRLSDVRLSDPDGVFLEAPKLLLDWRPAERVFNRLTLREIAADLVLLHRAPRLRPGEGQGQILPSFDMSVGRLSVTKLQLNPPVAGARRIIRLDARAELRAGRALIQVQAGAGRSDRLAVLLDAEPDRNRFDVSAAAISPENGVLGSVLGTRRPLDFRLRGDGDWQHWRGNARLLVNREPTLDLALRADAGRYRLSGTIVTANLLVGKLKRLTEPAIVVTGEGTLENRRLSGSLRLRSPALYLAARGTVDLVEGSFDPLSIDAGLLRPPALFPNMTGRDIRLTVVLDGTFRSARYAYRLAAPRIAFDETGFEQVRASGEGRLSPAPVRVPLRLGATRVTGVGDVAGGILSRLQVRGMLDVTSRRVSGRMLQFGSDKLRGTLDLGIDLATGRYDVALTGTLGRYLIPGLGIVDVESRLNVLPGTGGRGTLVTGRGRAAVRRFDNAFLRSLAGGLPRIETGLVRTPDGIVHFRGLRLTAPALSLTGNGYRRKDGTFHFEGVGTQARYGPVTLVLDGAIDHPQLRLRLQRPADALGLAGVEAALDPVPGGFTWRAAGGSALGPFTAEGRISTPADAPAAVEVASLHVTGAEARGVLRSDPAGFVGRLNVTGPLAGTVDFAPAGEIQRIETHLTASEARLAGPAAFAVRRGRLDANILLDPAATAIDVRVAAAGLRRGSLSLARLTGQVRLRGGQGTAEAAIAGSRGRAFQLRLGADLTPDQVRVTAAGTVDGKPLALGAPAVLRRDGEGGWRLAPATLSYAGGSATIAGRSGPAGSALDLRLNAMPLGVLDLGYPRLGLAGAATGSVAFSLGPQGVPNGRASVTIRRLSRAGLQYASTPIDLGVNALIDGRGAVVRAVANSGGRTIGRGQARLAPLGPGAELASRLAAAPLLAQLRFRGPADVLWRLTGVDAVDVAGPIVVAADARGRLDAPVIRGSIGSDAARVTIGAIGADVTGAALRARFDGARLIVDSFRGRAGQGTVSATGRFDLAASEGLGFSLALQAEDALLLNSDDLGATVTGPLTVRYGPDGGTIGGEVRLNRGRFRLGQAAAAAASSAPPLNVTELNRPDDEAEAVALPSPWRLDLRANARNRLAVTGLGLDSEWRARLAIRGTTEAPRITGEAELVRGGYEFAGRRFELERGFIRFNGESPPDPALDITAEAGITGLNATIRVTGTGQKPEIAFTSVPSLPEDELLSRLLFGTSINNLSAPEALQLAAAVNSLRDPGGGLDPINAVRRAAGLDRLRILPADVATGQRTTVAAGKYVTRRVYVEVATDGQGYSATRVEWELTRWLSLLSSISTLGRTSANIRISKDY